MLDELNPDINSEVLYRWKVVRDFKEGEVRVKNCGRTYLPMKSGSSLGDYNAYMQRGKVGDYTNQALETFHGQIMRKQPVVNTLGNSTLEKCMKNFNHEGDSFYQFASDTIADNLQTFFGGIMVDMPVAPSNVLSVYDAEKENIIPYARYYSAECVADWKYSTIHGVKVLTMVKLAEYVDINPDEFSHTKTLQYRILSLDENGEYLVRVMCEVPVLDSNGQPKVDEDDKPIKETVTTLAVYPTIRGKRLKYIPFIFTPYKKIETSLLYGVAKLHKHYYQQSCDYENAVHMTTVPTGYVTGHTQEKDPVTGLPVPIYLGKDIFLVFPEPDAKVGVLQFSGEGIQHCEEAIAQTLEQIGILGTRALAPDKAMSETSDAARIHRTGENCKLATYSKNMSEVFTKVLRIMAEWLGVEGNVSVQFNTDFDSIAFDPNALNAIANLSREGKYPLPLVFEALKKGEYLPNDMDFRQFAMLVSLEASGAGLEEVIDAYQKMRSGEDLPIKNNLSVKEINEKRAANTKSSDQTKVVSMQNGK